MSTCIYHTVSFLFPYRASRETQDLWVIDTDAQEVLSQVDTGDNPVHLYAIPSREEIWTHPDDSKD